jgi:ketol-acid reductoisomerase
MTDPQGGARPGPRIFRAADAEPDALAGERVAVIGYGHLGRTAALNLRDAGVDLRVATREDESAARARAEGFPVVPLAEAATADLLLLLLPDEVIPEVFARDLAPRLRPGSAVVFASGYCLAYELVDPGPAVDVLLLAPRMGGEAARERFRRGEGFWAYVGVEADRSGRARRRLLGLCAALGVLRQGAIETSAATEALVDLFVEQTVGPLLGAALMTAFDVGVAAGVSPGLLVMELYMSGEMESVFRAFREEGLLRAARSHGATALFGGLSRTLEIDRDALRERFQAVLEDLRSGAFAKRFQQEALAAYPVLRLAREMIETPSPLSRAEDELRSAAQGGGAPPA